MTVTLKKSQYLCLKHCCLELDAIVSFKQRSHFINEAVSKQIAIVKQTQGIEESAGIWTDEHHPDMQDDKAIDQWPENNRQNWSR